MKADKITKVYVNKESLLNAGLENPTGLIDNVRDEKGILLLDEEEEMIDNAVEKNFFGINVFVLETHEDTLELVIDYCLKNNIRIQAEHYNNKYHELLLENSKDKANEYLDEKYLEDIKEKNQEIKSLKYNLNEVNEDIKVKKMKLFNISDSIEKKKDEVKELQKARKKLKKNGNN